MLRRPMAPLEAGCVADDSDVLDVKGAAQYLGTDAETVRRLAEASHLAAFRVRGKWRFKKASLAEWARHAGRARPTILVVDDEDAVRHTVRRILEGEGYDVTTAAGGREALALLRLTPPDLVLLDLKMPGMDGAMTLGEMRREVSTLPVVILTGYPESDLMSAALKFAPAAAVSKPFEREEIVGAVRGLVAPLKA